MKIITTAIFLIITLILVLGFSFVYGTPLGEPEYETLLLLIYTTVGIATLCFILGELTKNYSQVDKIWSIAPILYVAIVMIKSDYNPRIQLMFALVFIWGVRLTYNFSRHGGYSLQFWKGNEDYRWKVLREKPEFQSTWKWRLFNLFFISGYQNALILLFTLPSIIALQFKETELNAYDFIIALCMLFFIVFESIADNQQWQFQTKKWALINNNQELSGDYKKGFLDKGLWAYSRHPNYFAEQGVWVCFYLFSVVASDQWINWSIAGCLLLIILFQGSSKFSEEISAGKYPEYKMYQNAVSRFIPTKWISTGSI